uniref:Uncharacterized protein n=1 Tax=Anguilla anguilla TaxID=7936 RepID=A0A0E9QMC8_ANGAN
MCHSSKLSRLVIWSCFSRPNRKSI